MWDRLRLLFLASILLVVVSSYLAIGVQTPEASYVLGAKTEEEGGFFKKYWIKVLKLLNLYQGDRKEPARTFEYVPGRLRTQPEFSQPAASPTPTPMPTASPYSRPGGLPPLPPLPPTTLGAAANSSAVNSQNLPPLPPATPVKDPVTSTVRSFFEGIYQSFGF